MLEYAYLATISGNIPIPHLKSTDCSGNDNSFSSINLSVFFKQIESFRWNEI